ncbi:MAG: aminoacyl-histidine dipeptidase [Spirochaetia bacterium]|jgi:dipeptidase D|nr:aminoacyl-histidine dipeptidase [Spirochaetia bacterium]
MTKNEIIAMEPSVVWNQFYEISQIPRCSTKEEKILAYLKVFCKKNNLTYKQDKIQNICIKKPATPGMENLPGVVLQGHVDMVCEKNAGTDHDFSVDPIKLLEKDGWVTADGTTLGADNGIAVAMSLAVLESKTIEHGPLEALFTIDEESALTGALDLDPSIVDGTILFNIDSEEEGIFYIGCAGGVTTIGNLTVEEESVPSGHNSYELQVTGFKGGHSGAEIHEERGNAISVAARILRDISSKTKVQTHKINGGGKHNAIPREIFISFTAEDPEVIVDTISEYSRILKNEIGDLETNMSVKVVEENSIPEKVFTEDFSNRLLGILYSLPHGVIKMSRKVPGLVETSTNLASIFKKNGNLEITTSQRSSVMSENDEIAGKVQAIMEAGGADVQFESRYPSWEPNPESNILKLFKKIYKREEGKEPGVRAIHAGLECGVIGDKLENMEMISFGPDMEDVHTPDERLKVSSVAAVWEFLLKVLKEV